jgi:hypothetical protein
MTTIEKTAGMADSMTRSAKNVNNGLDVMLSTDDDTADTADDAKDTLLLTAPDNGVIIDMDSRVFLLLRDAERR